MSKLADWQYAYRNELLKMDSEVLFGVMLDANTDLEEGFTTYRLWYAEEAVRQVEDRLLALEEVVEELKEAERVSEQRGREINSLLAQIKTLEEKLAE